MELDNALDDLESNRFVLSEHHLSLAVFADELQELADNLAKARSRLQMVVLSLRVRTLG